MAITFQAEKDDLRLPPRAWLVVALLWVVGCLNYIDRLMLTTMRDSIKSAIEMGDDDFGALTTVFLIVYGLLSPVGGWFADRYSRSRVIIISLAVWSVVTLLTAYVQTYQQLLMTRALMGISEACYIPAALALIADYHRGRTRSLATGIHMSGLYAGMALGGMGGWMAESFGWSSGFFVFGLVGVVFAGVLGIFLRDLPRAESDDSAKPSPSSVETIRSLAGNRSFGIIAIYWGLLGFAGWAFVAWMPTFLREHYQLSESKAGFTATVYLQLAAFIGVLVGGAIADRWSRTSLRGRINVPMIALMIASPFVFMTSQTNMLWFAIVCLIAFGFARGCVDANMMPILCQVASPQQRATGYGILNFFSCCIGGISPYLGGWLRERDVDLSYLLMGSAVGVSVSALLLLLVKPSSKGMVS
jgi:predicted MFS family arabinose efflux permease